jgi:hypothetical protein
MSGTTITRSEAANVERWRQGAAGLRGEQPQGREAGGHGVHPHPDLHGAWLCLHFPSLQLWA